MLHIICKQLFFKQQFYYFNKNLLYSINDIDK